MRIKREITQKKLRDVSPCIIYDFIKINDKLKEALV